MGKSIWYFIKLDLKRSKMRTQYSRIFSNKKKQAQKLLHSIEVESTIFNDCKDYNKILNFFSLHPKFNEKTSNGIRYFTKVENPEYGNNKCSFAVVDLKGNVIPFSIHFPEITNREKDVIRAFKLSLYPNNKINHNKNIYVDENNLELRQIVLLFLERNKMEIKDVEVEIIEKYYNIKDNFLCKRFINFYVDYKKNKILK
jgi:hypothetical protein